MSVARSKTRPIGVSRLAVRVDGAVVVGVDCTRATGRQVAADHGERDDLDRRVAGDHTVVNNSSDWTFGFVSATSSDTIWRLAVEQGMMGRGRLPWLAEDRRRLAPLVRADLDGRRLGLPRDLPADVLYWLDRSHTGADVGVVDGRRRLREPFERVGLPRIGAGLRPA